MPTETAPHRLRSLHNAAREIGVLQHEDAIAAATARHVASGLQAECAVVLLTERNKSSNLMVIDCFPHERMHHFPHLMHVDIEPHCLVARDTPMTIDDVDGIYSSIGAPYRNCSFAPIIASGQFLGLIGILREPESFKPIELELFCALGAVAGAAIGQARLRERVLAEETKKLKLSRYFSPQVVEKLMSDGELPREALRCQATVLFSDIRGFTNLSEGRDPEEVLHILNKYFEQMTDIVFFNGGMVDKFLGDGLLAVFGAPTPLSNHALAALECATQMVQASRNLDLSDYGIESLRIGVGLNSGPVFLGDLGGRGLLDFTVLGETVNLASRIQDLTKELGVELVLTETTRASAGDSTNTDFVGEISVRGFTQPVTLHSLQVA